VPWSGSHGQQPPGCGHARPQCSARQALEETLDELWSQQAPGLERASTTSQLLCLPALLPDRQLAGRAAHAWAALTHACHHHPYELPPTADELDRWLQVVDAMTQQLP
jgi:hypothetical protein